MDEEYAAINQLGGFALGNLLSDLGVEGGQPADMQRLGLGGGSAGFEQNQIYKEEYADDDDEELARYGLGRGEDGASDAGRGGETDGRADMDRYYRQGMEQVGPSAGHVRGEVDDFDDEDNDADAGGDAEELEMPRFKEEPWAHGPLEALRAESPPRRDVKEIWPGFEHDAVLNFTELFASRPAKRRRLVNRPPKCKYLFQGFSFSLQCGYQSSYARPCFYLLLCHQQSASCLTKSYLCRQVPAKRFCTLRVCITINPTSDKSRGRCLSPRKLQKAKVTKSGTGGCR